MEKIRTNGAASCLINGSLQRGCYRLYGRPGTGSPEHFADHGGTETFKRSSASRKKEASFFQMEANQAAVGRKKVESQASDLICNSQWNIEISFCNGKFKGRLSGGVPLGIFRVPNILFPQFALQISVSKTVGSLQFKAWKKDAVQSADTLICSLAKCFLAWDSRLFGSRSNGSRKSLPNLGDDGSFCKQGLILGPSCVPRP